MPAIHEVDGQVARGGLTGSSTLLDSEHIGATILALAVVEPENEVIMAVLAQSHRIWCMISRPWEISCPSQPRT